MKTVYTCIILLQIITMLVQMSQTVGVLEETTVSITNQLGKGTNLQVHCKSKQDDLGIHQLPFQSSYQFTFVPRIWGDTLFFCGFVWNNTLHWYDIYVQDRDAEVCGVACFWDVYEEHACVRLPPTYKPYVPRCLGYPDSVKNRLPSGLNKNFATKNETV
ncbi:hypothetical protein RND81_11G160500 [Saponaria officinalis]|uniref:S-protein homolog n=1 Tax=Saponaria officinalis TaxID=3572 RepID=A0AAW1HMN7_SAPOF